MEQPMGEGSSGGEGKRMRTRFAHCLRCREGVLLPLSDYGRDGAPIQFKAWACNNPSCGFNTRIENGEISYGRAISQSSK